MQKVQAKFIALIVIGAALLMSLQVLYFRLQYEADNTVVEIALEYGDLLKVASISQQQPLQLLEQLRLEGLTTLVLLDDHALNPNQELLEYLELSGLQAAAQLTNKPEYLESGVVEVLAKAVALPNLRMLFFAGHEALGWPDQVESVAGALAFINLPPGFVEMLGEQKGLEEIMAKARYQMIRIHPGYPYEDLGDMVRSVKERGIRFVFLKPFKNMGLEDPGSEAYPELQSASLALINNNQAASSTEAAEAVLHWVKELRQRITSAGFTLGGASAFAVLSLDRLYEFYCCAGIVAAALLLVGLLCSGMRWRNPLLVLAALGLCSLYASSWFGLADSLLVREIFALLAACVFPSLGLVRAQYRLRDMQQEPRDAIWRVGLQTLLESSLLTLCGALIVNAMLSETIYLSGWRPFRGVKLALLAPPLLVLGNTLWITIRQGLRLGDLRSLSPRRLLLAGAAFVVGAIYLLRSGNEVSSISGIERVLRLNLEDFFGARPRFKEFLLGHPATMLLGWPLAQQLPEIGLGLMLVAAIAQASMFNTFMHLHSPIILGLQRSLWGLALGEIIGVVALVALQRLTIND